MTVRLLLFGSPTIEHDGESFALPFERRSQLLAFLALKRAWVGRTELAAMLWPEQTNKLAYANLRKILHRLHSFPFDPQVELLGGALRFEVETDVSAFELALREKRTADALIGRRGELLAGFDDDSNEAWSSWLRFERDRLRVAWRTAALERLADDIEPRDGIALSQELLNADPLDEAALRFAMTWMARAGQASLAREVYRDFASRLSEELGLTPGAELKALFDSIGAGAGAAPARAAVPTLDDGLVGRTVELRRLAALLTQDDCRLVCVTGPGGVGKTRLVRRAIEDLAGSFLHGAAFVPLEDMASIGEIGGRLARELQVSLRGSRDPLEQVIAHLGEQQMLLVLDNFEHIAAASPALERLLSGCTRLKLLVTSRVRLALAAEWLLPLDGLPCPEPEDEDRIEAFDAALLFVRAAQRVEPALVPSREAAAIIDICRQVEGLPLALELAAAWTRVMSCEAIAAELRQSIGLLHATESAQPARHASMDVVFDQSWQLLSAAEQTAVARLSVFRGGFSAEAARAVAGASLPVLGALADKSLLRKDGARTSMHPLVQQLAARRLGDGGTRDSAQRAHADYFHRWMAQSRRSIEAGAREALHWMETEFENCRLAWRWSAAQGGNRALAQSALTLLYFCDHRGRFEDGLSLLHETLESVRIAEDRAVEALLLSVAAHFEFRLDRCSDAEATALRALAASDGPGYDDAKLQCLKVLGSCCVRVGRNADAKQYFLQALQVASESTHPHSAAAMYANLAVIEKNAGQYDDALRLLLQSLALHRRLGDVAGAAGTLSTLGGLYVDKRDYETAGAYLRDGLAICDRHGLVRTRGVILANLTEVALKTNDFDLAESHATRAIEIAQSTGNRGLASWTKLQLVRLALQRGDLPAARSELASSMAIALAVVQSGLQLAGIICLAQILHAQGESECARGVMKFAVDHPSIDAAERDEMRAQLAQWPPAAGPMPEWPGMDLSELADRVVVESAIAYAPLIATLRGAR